jgi:hypothetical protein
MAPRTTGLLHQRVRQGLQAFAAMHRQPMILGLLAQHEAEIIVPLLRSRFIAPIRYSW